MADLPEMWAHDPTLRERTQDAISRGLQRVGLSPYEANRNADSITGSRALGAENLGIGLLDFTPAGLVFGLQEGGRAVERGRNIGGVEGAIQGGLGLLEIGLNAIPGALTTRAVVNNLRTKITDQMRRSAPNSGSNEPILLSQFDASNYPHSTLPGLPNRVRVGDEIREVGTDQRIVDLAQQYTNEQGLLYRPQPRYAEVDPERARRIAQAYEDMPNAPLDPEVRLAYDAMIDETMAQYDLLKRNGYSFEFMPRGRDPYGNSPRNAIRDIIENKHLYVFPTESGFGGSATGAARMNPLLRKVGEKWNGKDVTANDIFRAVHDVFGHAKHGAGFRAVGEENAWQSHARMYSPRALPAVTAETRGQNSWVNFGPYGQSNRTASQLETQYAEQKVGRLPDWVLTEGLL